MDLKLNGIGVGNSEIKSAGVEPDDLCTAGTSIWTPRHEQESDSCVCNLRISFGYYTEAFKLVLTMVSLKL